MGTALITGASAGLGLEFAKLFAADKHDLVLVARRKDRLDELATKLAADHQVKVEVIAADLMAADASDKILREVAERKLEIDFLVNNAGYGTTGRFVGSDVAKERGMIAVNVTALTELTRGVLPGMIARGRGRVLNISSTAAFQPGPFMAVYYASKAYVSSFSEALVYELKGTGVTVTVSCPGPTLTEFSQVAGMEKSRLFAKGGAMSSVDVATQAYRAMHAGKVMIVHGFMNALSAFSVRFSPRWLVRAIAGTLNSGKDDGKPQLKA